jgi:hypothetical protein
METAKERLELLPRSPMLSHISLAKASHVATLNFKGRREIDVSDHCKSIEN